MKICEIKDKIRQFKKINLKIETNFYFGILNDGQEAEVFENEKALVFIVQEPNRIRAFFAFAEKNSLRELLLKIPSGTVMEYIHKEQENPLEHIFIAGGMEQYAVFLRRTFCYSENPYTIPETGRRKLLAEMYDPSCGEYATDRDVRELYELDRENFDVLCDGVFDLEQWKQVVSNQECLLCRENGKIIAFYVFRLQGKKLYGNRAMNLGPANYLYNLERRVFEDMWNKGIQVFYSWYNVKNTKALNRFNKEADRVIKFRSIIYNTIYIKK